MPLILLCLKVLHVCMCIYVYIYIYLSQETPGVTGKFGLGIRNEAGQRLTEFCQENALVIAQRLPTTQEKTVHMDITRWPTPKSD